MKTPRRQIQYRDDIDLLIGDGISADEEDLIRKKVEDHLQVKEDAPVEAKYVVEVFFSSDFSMIKPSAGALSFWERGMLGGAAETKLYCCPGKELKFNECVAFIPDTALGFEEVFCSACGQKWKRDQLYGEILGRHSLKEWATLVTKYFQRLKLDTDLRVKYPSVDIRKVSREEEEKKLRGSLLTPARASRVVRTHSLHDIIRQTSAGADLHSCILSCLKA